MQSSCKNRKNRHTAKGKAFSKYAKRYSENNNMKEEIKRTKKYCTVVRALCHTQIGKIKIRQQKAHLFENQVNGG